MDALVDPVFVVGCPRSGTSLVAAQIDGSSELAITPETHFFSHWLPRFPGLRAGRREEFEAFWPAFQAANFRWLRVEPSAVHEPLAAEGRWDARAVFSCLLSSFAAEQGKPRAGEKTPTHYRALGTLLQWYPTARSVFVVRDPRSVVSSYFDLAERVPWARGNAFAIARRWLDAATAAQRWSHDRRVVLVRYETLVTDPSGELERLRTFLDLSTDEPASSSSDYRSRPAAGGGLVPNAAVSTERVDRWRTRLRPRDVQVIEQVCATRMRGHGYEPESGRTPEGLACLATQATGTLLSYSTARARRLFGMAADGPFST